LKHALTIVIPTYNAIRHCENWDKIITVEKYSNIEFIFVDSNSVDGTSEYLDSLTKKFENVFFFKIESTIYEAMNFGVFKSSTNWILFIGIDDYLLKPIINLFKYFDDPKIKNFDLLIVNYQISINGKIKFKNSKNQLKYPHHQSCIFNKTSLKNLDYIYDTSYSLFSDMDLIFRILSKNKILYLPYNCVNFSKGGKSTNGKHFKQTFKELTLIAFKHNKIISKFYLISVFRIIYYLIRNAIRIN
jgi:hypothetical protein